MLTSPDDEGARMPTLRSDLDLLAAARTRVEDAMHRGVVTCSRHDPLSVVAELMARHRIHAVVVAADHPAEPGALWGVVSDLDLVAAASVRDLSEQTAGATAATPALTIAPGDSLQRAAQLMTEHTIAHLVVAARDGEPVGVISTLDVVAALAEGETSRD
jgi:CBS domain-containing protein